MTTTTRTGRGRVRMECPGRRRRRRGPQPRRREGRERRPLHGIHHRLASSRGRRTPRLRPGVSHQASGWRTGAKHRAASGNVIDSLREKQDIEGGGDMRAMTFHSRLPTSPNRWHPLAGSPDEDTRSGSTIAARTFNTVGAGRKVRLHKKGSVRRQPVGHGERRRHDEEGGSPGIRRRMERMPLSRGVIRSCAGWRANRCGTTWSGGPHEEEPGLVHAGLCRR